MPTRLDTHTPRTAKGEGYSYQTRDTTSRAFARERRFGEADKIGAGTYSSAPPLSHQSLPLQWNADKGSAVPVSGSALINARQQVLDIHLTAPMPGTNHKFDKIEPLVPSYIGTSDPKPYAYGSGMNAGYLSQDDPNDLPKQLGMPREQFYTYSRLIQNDRVLAKYRNEDTYVHPIVPHFVKQELGDYNYVEGKGERDPEMQPFAKGAKDLAVYMAHRQANENDEIIKCTQIREGSDPDCKKCNPDFCKSKVPCGVKLNAEQSRSALDEAAEEAADAKELSKFYPQKNRFFGAPCPPLLDMDLRNHTVWEGMTAKFIIKGTGNPKPTCQFFHNNIPIEVNLHAPGKYRITENASGMHVLEISRITIKDGGIIKAQLQNHKGAIDSIGFLNVRRHTDAKYGYFDIKSGYNLTIPSAYPDVENLNVPGYPRFVTRLHNKVCFEQDAVTLCCKVDGKPAPDVFWTLNGKTVQHIPGHIEVEFDKRSGLTSLTIYSAFKNMCPALKFGHFLNILRMVTFFGNW